VSEFRSFNNGTSKGVLDLLETMYLRLRKIVEQRELGVFVASLLAARPSKATFVHFSTFLGIIAYADVI